MKVILLTLTFYCLSATAFSQRITLNMSNITVKEAIHTFKEKTGYSFVYEVNDIDSQRKISVKTTNKTIDEVVKQILIGQNVSYTIQGKSIVVTKNIKTTTATTIDNNQTQKKITGLVTDDKGEPIIGASISIKGLPNGTVTDINGKFSLETLGNSQLKISYIGFITAEIDVNNHDDISVQMKEDTRSLDEVVVVGYSVQKKVDIIGSVGVVSAKSLNNTPVIGIGQALQGKVSGLRVTQTTGQPGEAISVRIRGVGTVNDNDPLYIIDGVPSKDGMNLVSPSDIESISILKDAASCAIYGARSANGVVLVTTKKGVNGKTKVNYNGYIGTQTHGKLIQMADTKGYVEVFNESVKNDNAMVDNDLFKRKPIPYDPSTLPNVNYLNSIFRVAPTTSHQLSISGGNENSDFIISLGYLNQKGIILKTDYERYSVRAAINNNIGTKIKNGININYVNSNRNLITSSGHNYGVVRYALFRTSAIPIKDENGQWVDLPTDQNFWGNGYSPLGMLDKYDNKEKSNRIFGNLYFTYNPIKNLTIKTELGLNFNAVNNKQFWEMWGTDNRIANPPTLNVNNYQQVQLNWTNSANYNLTIKDNNNFNFLLGHEMVRSSTSAFSGNDSQYLEQDQLFRYLGLGSSKTKTVGESFQEWSLLSFFGKVSYDYKGKYLISSNIRYDGSSRFAPENRFGTFYSGALGWRMDKENFFQPLIPVVSMFKIRASYGQLGNQEIGVYPTATIYSKGYNYIFGNPQTMEYGYAVSSRGNENIKWETTIQQDAGVDAGFFNSKLQLSFDYFNKITDNMLVNAPVSAIGGSAAAPFINAGKVQNSGTEFELNYRDKKGEFSYELGGNVSFIKNKVLSLGSGQPILGGEVDNGVFITKTQVGQPIGSFYMLQMSGIFQSKIEVATSAFQGANIQPGDVRYIDQNQDNVIDDKDRVFCGSAIPNFTYGFNADLNYKSFDLSLFFQGVSGNKIYMQVGKDIEGFYRNLNVTQRFVDNYWKEDRPSNIMPRASWFAAPNNIKPSTRFLFDGSYLRLKNIQLGYNISKKIIDKLNLSSCRFYLSAENLLTITKYIGMEPELTTSANNPGERDLASGIDWGTYPSAITYTFGLNINF